MFIEQFKQQRLKTKTLHKRDRSPATVNRELQVLSKVFSMAYDNGLVETNPMRRVQKLREAPARERYLTDEEEKRLFAVLVGRRAHIRSIVVVALQTGMRQGEILGLKWEQVDFDQKTIYVAHTKTGRPRRIPMSAPVEVELRSLKQDALSDEYVFSYARTGLKLTTFRHAWEGACKAAKISGLRFRSAAHVCDSFTSKGCARDGHHDIVGPHHLADDFSIHSRNARESPHRSGFSEQAATAVSSKNRAKIAPTRYRDGWELIE